MGLLSFYRSTPAAGQVTDRAEIERRYRRTRVTAFWSIVFGYSFFYVCRLSFSVAKKPMLEDGVLDVEQMGNVGLALFFTYAFGKLINGFLTDWTHAGRMMATGLLGSSMLVILFGVKWPVAGAFIVIWGLNGWFQSMGSPPCGAILASWFSNRERGTRYGIWSTSHSIGSAFTFAVTGMIVGHYGWQWGFWVAGGACLAMAFYLFFALPDRPRSEGLPTVACYLNDTTAEAAPEQEPLHRAQWEVIKNPFIWILGLSSACMYISRYAMESWGVLYLQEANSYALVNAGFLFSVSKVVETFGTACCGIISDFFFQSRRNVTTLLYGVLMCAGLAVFIFAPSARVGAMDTGVKAALDKGELSGELVAALGAQGAKVDAERFSLVKTAQKSSEGWIIQPKSWAILGGGYHVFEGNDSLVIARQYLLMHLLGASLFGFGVGGLIALLGGLIAIDICPKRVSGAAMGMIGMFSYLGASLQERITGSLLKAGETVTGNGITHDFSAAALFWLGASVLSVVFYCALWNVKSKE